MPKLAGQRAEGQVDISAQAGWGGGMRWWLSLPAAVIIAATGNSSQDRRELPSSLKGRWLWVGLHVIECIHHVVGITNHRQSMENVHVLWSLYICQWEMAPFHWCSFYLVLILSGFTLRLGHPPVFYRTKGVQTVNIIEQKYKEDHTTLYVLSLKAMPHWTIPMS